MKFESDTPAELVRCCLWKTPRAVRAPEAPDKSDRTSSFDCPSNRLRLIPASILPGKVFTPCLYSLLPPPRQFLLTFFFFASVIWSNECSTSPPSDCCYVCQVLFRFTSISPLLLFLRDLFATFCSFFSSSKASFSGVSVRIVLLLLLHLWVVLHGAALG